MTSHGPQRPPRRITPLEPARFGFAGFPLSEAGIVELVQRALDEDVAFEDVTTLATVLPTQRARARIVAREPGVISGVPFALAAFRLLDERVEIRVDAEDGRVMQRAETVLFLSGHARGMLAAERTALNFMQHLSGIASLTRRFVEAVRGTRAAIVDTRKTLPGWRRLEKYAVR
jgi:nicotinate-nucleotide pyrophosphorylase (carboxylating)